LLLWRELVRRETKIKRIDPFFEPEGWLRRLRNEAPLHRVIVIVTRRLEQAEGDDHRFLAYELTFLLREAERYREALQLLDDMLQRYPDDVLPAIGKANIFFVALDEPEEALRCVDAALERAHRTKFFRRQALGDKARILLKLRRGEELSDVLEEIMSLQMVKNIPDISRERDFIDGAPPGLIRKNVLDRYNEFRPKRPGDGLADEPPEYEAPDDYM
jgi:tetratricopeptide (TPR) repeat protein